MPLFEQVAEARTVAAAAPAPARAPAPAPVAAPAEPAAAAVDYVLPIDTAAKRWRTGRPAVDPTRTPQDPRRAGGDGGEPAPIQCRARSARSCFVDEGPLVLVETRKDLSQVRLPFENQAPPRSLSARTRALRGPSPSAPAASPLVRAGARGRAGRQASASARPRPTARSAAAARRGAPRSPGRAASGRRSACEQAVEQRVDRGAAVERLVAKQHHVAAGAQRQRSRPRRSSLDAADAAGAGHAQVVAEDAPSKPSCIAQDLLQPARARSRPAACRPSDRRHAPASRSRALVRATRRAARRRRGSP